MVEQGEGEGKECRADGMDAGLREWTRAVCVCVCVCVWWWWGGRM